MRLASIAHLAHNVDLTGDDTESHLAIRLRAASAPVTVLPHSSA
jgi:hypothetical protein